MIRTRLTEKLGILHPVISAPMAFAAGGRLAGAISEAGGLGLIGGGYADGDWIEAEFAEAGNRRVGCGFITWALAERPEALDAALAHGVPAIMLSFGDAAPFAPAIHEAGSLLICQVQTLALARDALDAGADIIVAQGSEAGGHGGGRGTLSLVPEIADLIARRGSEAIAVAAGGIADGRGLAAALMLGAEGVLVGSRFWASSEAKVHANHHKAALEADGDGTVRQSVTDIARRFAWPAQFTGRILRNAFTERWHGREAELREAIDTVSGEYAAAVAAGDAQNAGVWVGEAAGLIRSIEPAGDILASMVSQAEELLVRRAPHFAA